MGASVLRAVEVGVGKERDSPTNTSYEVFVGLVGIRVVGTR